MKGTCTCDGGDEGTNVLAGIKHHVPVAYKQIDIALSTYYMLLPSNYVT